MTQHNLQQHTSDTSNMTRKDTGISEEKNNVSRRPDNPASKPHLYAEDPQKQNEMKTSATQ